MDKHTRPGPCHHFVRHWLFFALVGRRFNVCQQCHPLGDLNSFGASLIPLWGMGGRETILASDWGKNIQQGIFMEANHLWLVHLSSNFRAGVWHLLSAEGRVEINSQQGAMHPKSSFSVAQTGWSANRTVRGATTFA